MAKIKNTLKAFIPPIIIAVLRRLRNSSQNQVIWSGNYKTWEAAQAKCSGYDSDNILERVKNSLLKVKNGEAVYDGTVYCLTKFSIILPFWLVCKRQRLKMEEINSS